MVVTLLPSTVDFGTIAVGQSSPPADITLRNGTSQSVKISGTAIGTDYKIVSNTCPSTLAAGQSCDYFVSFQPLTTGTKNESFIVTAGGSQKVNLKGVGVR